MVLISHDFFFYNHWKYNNDNINKQLCLRKQTSRFDIFFLNRKQKIKYIEVEKENEKLTEENIYKNLKTSKNISKQERCFVLCWWQVKIVFVLCNI